MSKSKGKKVTSHRQRQKRLNQFLQEGNALAGYNKGHKDGFTNCLTIMMYSIFSTTHYKQNGLLKIWNRTLDIAEALTMPVTGLTMEDIQLALAAEGGIVSDESSNEQARLVLQKNGGKPNGEYKKILDAAMETYKAAIEARENESAYKEVETNE